MRERERERERRGVKNVGKWGQNLQRVVSEWGARGGDKWDRKRVGIDNSNC